MPVELLAQFLLECAQADAALPRRPPANDDASPDGFSSDGFSVDGFAPDGFHDDMRNRLEALEALRLEPRAIRVAREASPPVIPPAEAASNEDLEELVAVALASAQDAEDIAREANQASRSARRGMFIAAGVAALGIAIATAGTIGSRLLYSGDTRQMADIAKQVQTLGDLQKRINDQLTQMQPHQGVQEASSVQEAGTVPAHPGAPSAQPADPSSPPLPALKATEVAVLPATPAKPQAAQGTVTRPSPTEQSPVPYTPTAGYAAYPPGPPPLRSAPPVASGRWWPAYHPPVRHYRTRVVLPRPVYFFVTSVQRDVGALFR
jgi:hypothetical protein